MMHRKLYLYFYILAVVATAGAVAFVAFQVHPISDSQVIPLIVFSVFLVTVELFEVRTAIGARWIPTATVDLSAWVLFGPTIAIIMEALSIVLGDGLIRRKPPLKVLFNLSVASISAGCAGFTYVSLPGSDQLSTPVFLLPALGSFLVFSILNMGLTAIVIAISDELSVRETFDIVFGWHFLSGLFAAPLAALLVMSYEFAGLWSLGLFAIPLYVVYQAHRLFEEMRRSYKNTVAALTTALEADEPYTHGHSYRVAQYALRIGRRMRMSAQELETLEYAGMLHDIGKIAITNDIVCKPARLSKEEFDILASHPAIGGEIVEQMEFLRDAADLVRHHHERPDGQGYPDGLKGDEISLGSHILNLCDAVDAMCSNRPYRSALSLQQCLEEIERFSGSQFDARVAGVFAEMVREDEFEVIEQTDGAARKIQEIIRKAAEESARKRASQLQREQTHAA